MSVIRDSAGAIVLAAGVLGGMWVATTVVMGDPNLWALGDWRAVSLSDFTNYPYLVAGAVLGGIAMGYWEANT